MKWEATGALPLLTGVLPPLAAVVILVLAALFFSGCYTVKQGTILLGYLGRATPLEELAQNPDTGDEAEKNRLFAARALDIRAFAMDELGLQKSKNYTRYVSLDRDYLAVVVSACAADSFSTRLWHYPVVGALPYKGFFDPADARKEAARLSADGLDVWVRGVDAFSTLGWFKDPLYSYMREYPVYALADLIIHELLHATVFIKGQPAFNEQLAEYAGSEGARLYTLSRFGENSPEYRRLLSGRHDAAAFAAFLRGLSAELDGLYGKTTLDRGAKIAEKERIISAAKTRFAAEYDGRFENDAYRFFSDLPVNNAYLDLYRLYEADTFFADLAAETGAGLSEFIAAAKLVTGKNPRQELRERLGIVP
ncbi:MAG: aminopeptidase [Treponema sp.]|jgi:predicted aminopeptidase|nr:aminopeptidase [Treponema sp.]